jgi:hypothetical protein
MYFKNVLSGLKVLEWWRQRCFEWCYAKNENGKFGDQKYLDDWTTRFDNIYVPTHIGCGLAPWNINQYDLSFTDDRLYVQDKITKERNIVIFYHFHNLKKINASLNRLFWYLGGYKIEKNTKDLIYKEYTNIIAGIERGLDKVLIMPLDINNRKNMEKPSFFSLSWLVVKNILKSILIVRQYNRLKKEMDKKYNQFKNNLLETLLSNN